jgi:hypothetical protein
LQDFLGGRIKLPPGMVCDRCNAATSRLDGDLARVVRLLKVRTDEPMLRGAQALAQLSGLWWATRLRDPTWERVLPTQIVLRANAPPLAWGTESVLAQMRAELAAPEQLDTSGLAEFREITRGQPVLVRAKEGYFKLIAADGDASWAETLLRSRELPRADWERPTDLQQQLDGGGVAVKGVLDAPLNHAHRALAKVAVSFLAHCLGEATARLPLFHALRRVVLNDERHDGFLINMEALRREAKGAIEQDDAHVVAVGMFERSGDEASRLAAELLRPRKHSLFLGAGRRGLFVFVSLYGRPMARVPLLAKLPNIDVSGILGAMIVDPENVEGDEVCVLPLEKRNGLVRLLTALAACVPESVAPPPTPALVAAEPQPFVFQFVYAPPAVLR